MGLYLVYLVSFVISLVAAISVFLYWVANPNRIAAQPVGRAEEQALRIHKDADREADTRKKEALFEAKEKAHELRLAAEREAREKSLQLTQLEQQLARRETTIVERSTASERKERELQARLQSLAEKE